VGSPDFKTSIQSSQRRKEERERKGRRKGGKVGGREGGRKGTILLIENPKSKMLQIHNFLSIMSSFKA
jgi:hypothetical protein